MPDRIHAAVHDMQPTRVNAVIDLGEREAERQKLSAGDSAVLASGEVGQRPIKWAGLTLYIPVNPAHSP